MKNESEKIKEIIEREGKIKESILNLNFIINLLDDCESENEKIQFVALRSTHRVFEHLLSLEDFAKILLEFKKNSENKKQKVEEDAKNELLNFLKQNYQDFFQLLFNFLSSPKQSTKVRFFFFFYIFLHFIYILFTFFIFFTFFLNFVYIFIVILFFFDFFIKF